MIMIFRKIENFKNSWILYTSIDFREIRLWSSKEISQKPQNLLKLKLLYDSEQFFVSSLRKRFSWKKFRDISIRVLEIV